MGKDQKKSDGRTEIIPSIPDTPENVARAIMMNKPKKEWDYLKRNQERKFGVGKKKK